MPTVKERYNWRHTWRLLIDKVLACAAEPLRPAPELRYAHEAYSKWVAPTADPADIALCAAFAAMAVAYSYETTIRRRRRLAPALIDYAQMVAAILEEMVQPATDGPPLRPMAPTAAVADHHPYRLPHADD